MNSSASLAYFPPTSTIYETISVAYYSLSNTIAYHPRQLRSNLSYTLTSDDERTPITGFAEDLDRGSCDFAMAGDCHHGRPGRDGAGEE